MPLVAAYTAVCLFFSRMLERLWIDIHEILGTDRFMNPRIIELCLRRLKLSLELLDNPVVDCCENELGKIIYGVA